MYSRLNRNNSPWFYLFRIHDVGWLNVRRDFMNISRENLRRVTRSIFRRWKANADSKGRNFEAVKKYGKSHCRRRANSRFLADAAFFLRDQSPTTALPCGGKRLKLRSALYLFYFQPLLTELEECSRRCPWLLLVILINRFSLTEVWKLLVFWFSGRFFRSLKISLHSTHTPNDSTPTVVSAEESVVRKQSRDTYASVDIAAALFAFNELSLGFSIAYSVIRFFMNF
jgi:hypothetical protein